MGLKARGTICEESGAKCSASYHQGKQSGGRVVLKPGVLLTKSRWVIAPQ